MTKRIELNGFTFVQEEKDIMVLRDGKAILRFTGDNANANINSVIVGLMAVNPGPNPELWSTSMIAKRFNRDPASVMAWRRSGNLPAIVDVVDSDSVTRQRAPRLAVPAALIDLIVPPTQGNPQFKTAANPSFRNRKDKPLNGAKSTKTGTKLVNLGD